MIELRQSTAVDVLVGPFVDDTDGKTEEGALTISQGDVLLSKNGQALAQKNDSTACAFDDHGCYNCELDTTDTGTLGSIVLVIYESGALPVRHEYMVVSQNYWDTKYSTEKFDVNVAEIEGADPTDTINAACDTALSDYDAPTKAEMDTAHGLLATEAKQDVIDGLADEIKAAVITNAAGADVAADIIAVKAETALIVADTNELQSDDIPGTLATIDGIVDNILVDTAVIGALGAGLTAVPWNSAWDAEVQSEVNDALVALHLDHLFAATYDATSKPGAADALLNEMVEDDSGVTRYTANAIEQASGSGATASEVRIEMDANSTQLAAIVADTNELQVDNTPGALSTIEGKIDTIDTNVDAILVDTGTTLQAEVDAIQAAVITNAAGADIAADIIAVKAETALIVADTNELQTDDIPTTLAAMDGKIDTVDGVADAILVDTGTTLPATLSTIEGKIDTVDGVADAVLVDTGTTLQAELDAIQAAVITNAAGADVAADIIALKAETALIVADTNELQTDDVPGLIGALNDITVDNILDAAAAVDGYTPRQVLALALAALAGKLSGAATTTVTVRSADDNHDRITATVDADGNRSAVTLETTGIS